MPQPLRQLRFALYLALNVCFLVVLAIGCAIGNPTNPRLLYLVALFAICSSSIIDLDGLNGRYSLLAMFLATYFVFYGTADLFDLFSGKSTVIAHSAFSPAEAVILIGGIMLVAGYRAAIMIGSSVTPGSAPRDWSTPAIVTAGLVIWGVGTYATYTWNVHVVTDTTIEATRKGLASLSPLATVGYIFAQMVQPVGILLIAYAWRVRRMRYLAGLVIVIVAAQVVLGFIIDIKGLAMLGGILVIVSIVLIEGRVPKLWLAAAVAFVQLAFPVFQAYREVVHGDLSIARTTVAHHLGAAVKLAISAEHRVNTGFNRAQSFFERASLLGSVEMIVDRTGKDVPFEHGYTLVPLISVFIPKIIWRDKPDVQAGRVVNKMFQVSEQAATYISPSHLGELYWNFGWPGVLVGMSIIGCLFGFIGSRFNLRDARTVTRLLVTVVTIQQLMMGFEGTIAVSYVVWLRSLAAIAVLHLLFARNPVIVHMLNIAGEPGADVPPQSPAGARPFPNLLS